MHLQNLRQATSSEHKGLEYELDLLRQSFTLAEYVALLRRFQLYLRHWEPLVLDRLVREIPGLMGPRMKLEAIEKDMQDLAFVEAAENIPPGLRPVLPELDTPAQAIGSMYVLEGSTLGGQILSRHFEKQLGVTRDRGCRYFSGYGQDTGMMWKSFCKALESRPARETAEMAEAAAETFRSLRIWLSGAHGHSIQRVLPPTQKGAIDAGN
jgi:heme oxygenase (biliverdin-IX-beta and delta-forming)